MRDNQISYQPPEQYLIYLINRKLVQRDLYFTNSNKYQTKIFGKPIMLLVNQSTTGRAIYEEVWMRVRFMLNFTHAKFFEDPMNFWWNKYEDDEIRAVALNESN